MSFFVSQYWLCQKTEWVISTSVRLCVERGGWTPYRFRVHRWWSRLALKLVRHKDWHAVSVLDRAAIRGELTPGRQSKFLLLQKHKVDKTPASSQAEKSSEKAGVVKCAPHFTPPPFSNGCLSQRSLDQKTFRQSPPLRYTASATTKSFASGYTGWHKH